MPVVADYYAGMETMIPLDLPALGLTAQQVADALAVEAADSAAATTYANILAIRTGDEKRPELQALYKALCSDKIKEFMKTKYEGAVLATH